MFRKFFNGGGKLENILLRKLGNNGTHIAHLGGAAGEGAGFVEGDFFDRGEPFKGIAFLDKKSVLCGVADGGHYGSRSGQNKGAGAENNKYSDRADDLSGDEPCYERGAEGDNNYPRCPSVGKIDDFCLVRIG